MINGSCEAVTLPQQVISNVASKAASTEQIKYNIWQHKIKVDFVQW